MTTFAFASRVGGFLSAGKTKPAGIKAHMARLGRGAAASAFLLLAAACAGGPQLQSPRTIGGDGVALPVSAKASITPLRASGATPQKDPNYDQVPNESVASPRAGREEALPGLEGEPVSVSVPKLPIPRFIATVMGELLGLNYVMLGKINERTELISLQTANNTTRARFFRDFQATLGQFGVAVTYEAGQYKFFDSDTPDQIPEFIRTRSQGSTPDGMGPITQIVTLKSIDANVALELLNQMLGPTQAVKITASQSTNSLLVTGLPPKVSQVMELIAAIDQSNFSGSQAATITPVFWSAANLATALAQVLTSEGYNVSTNPTLRRAIMLVPVQFTNQLVVFAEDPKLLQRAMRWWRELDRAEVVGDVPTVFIYQVQNTSARLIAEILNKARPGASPAAVPSSAPASSDAAAAPAQPVAVQAVGGLVVDETVNRLLFNGTPAEYQRLLPLIEQLDSPPREVYIEVAIAEVTLTDETRFGVEWQLDNIDLGGDLVGSIGTDGGLGLAADGLVARVVGANGIATLSALAKNQAVNLLSRPRLVARSGAEAKIQVGTDVPIITSQRASEVQDGGSTDVLQQVQYRQTGIVLNIKPTILGDGRVDVEISQEVSEAQSNPNQSIASPIILNRQIMTTLSLRDGTTAVIGGLMQDNTTTGETGIPLLKDIPWLGAIFKTDSIESRKTELLVLITPYILDDPRETQLLAGELQRRVNNAMYDSAYGGGTLLPATFALKQKERPAEVVVPLPRKESPPAERSRGPKYPRKITYECSEAKSISATFQNENEVVVSIDGVDMNFTRDKSEPTIDRFTASGGYIFHYAVTTASVVRNGAVIVQGCVSTP